MNRLGKIILRRRKELGLSRADLQSRLKAKGYEIGNATIRDWEYQRKRQPLESQPEFLKALASAIDLSYLHLIEELGFPNGLPDGITPEAMAIAHAIMASPEEMRDMIKEVVSTILRQEGL